MFNKKTEEGNFKEVETVIGPSVKVKGNFNGQGNIVVEGIIEGGLKTAGSVLVGEQARILGNIEAIEARVGGKIDGNLKIDGALFVEASAVINGDIDCSAISIDKGAMLNGNFTMGKEGKRAEKAEKADEE